jgi:hypothetical protein
LIHVWIETIGGLFLLIHDTCSRLFVSPKHNLPATKNPSVARENFFSFPALAAQELLFGHGHSSA